MGLGSSNRQFFVFTRRAEALKKEIIRLHIPRENEEASSVAYSIAQNRTFRGPIHKYGDLEGKSVDEVFRGLSIPTQKKSAFLLCLSCLGIRVSDMPHLRVVPCDAPRRPDPKFGWVEYEDNIIRPNPSKWYVQAPD